MDTVQTLPPPTGVTTDSIRRQAYAVSYKTSSEKDANFTSTSKAKQPLGDQDVKELEDKDCSDSDSEGLTFYDEELEDSSDSYSKDQTGYFEELEDSSDSYIKPTNSFEEASRRYLAHLASVRADLLAKATCPIAIAEKEKDRLRKEEIKKMTPEQYKEHKRALLDEMLSNLKEPKFYGMYRCSNSGES